jgi:hypothetical protein
MFPYLSIFKVRQIKVPYGQESSFLEVLGETFPQMNPNLEAFKTDRRRIVPLKKKDCCQDNGGQRWCGCFGGSTICPREHAGGLGAVSQLSNL